MELCEQKSLIIQYFDTAPPLIKSHKLRRTNSGAISGFYSTCFRSILCLSRSRRNCIRGTCHKMILTVSQSHCFNRKHNITKWQISLGHQLQYVKWLHTLHTNRIMQRRLFYAMDIPRCIGHMYHTNYTAASTMLLRNWSSGSFNTSDIIHYDGFMVIIA